jgi:large conductance mechanosensitive channel
MSILSEFREFIARGNVVDLAVGVIIGGAFGKIVTALVEDVIMPPIGLLTSGVDFSHMNLVLKADNPATKVDEMVAIQYGAFLNTVIQFMIVAWVVFLLGRAEAAEAAEAAPPPAPSAEETLLAEIRDLLKSGR